MGFSTSELDGPKNKADSTTEMQWSQTDRGQDLLRMFGTQVDQDSAENERQGEPKERAFGEHAFAALHNTQAGQLAARAGSNTHGNDKDTAAGRAQKEANRHDDRYTRLITWTAGGAILSDEASRLISSVVGDSMKGVNSAAGKLDQAKQQVAALEGQRAPLNMIEEEMTPQQVALENAYNEAYTTQIQTEHLELPGEINSTFADINNQLMNLPDLDPETAGLLKRGDIMLQAKQILAGETAENAHPLATEMAEEVRNQFAGTSEQLQKAAEQAYAESAPSQTSLIDPGMGHNTGISPSIALSASPYEYGPTTAVTTAAGMSTGPDDWIIQNNGDTSERFDAAVANTNRAPAPELAPQDPALSDMAMNINRDPSLEYEITG